MIELDSIEKTYETGGVATPVLKGVSFHVRPGEYVAIMGGSGTGKSTLMNILGCLDKPSAGRYRLDGEDVAKMDDDALSVLRNRKIGFVFQQFHLLERATALRNVMLPLIYAEEYPDDAQQRAEAALADVGLADRLRYRPTALSGGQQQRVAIARALVNNPQVLLADEPTGNLDRTSGLEVLAVFQRLNRAKRTLILVTHDERVAEHAQRILVLRYGRIAEDRAVPTPRNAEAELQEARA
ncbi:MAG: ABC transporter ATP-binding protein [Candidatus Sumerlaeota bacterium]|nr:ABC transporter ATP-binding protein [Candidatus Sumerlaeota bacterium]